MHFVWMASGLDLYENVFIFFLLTFTEVATVCMDGYRTLCSLFFMRFIFVLFRILYSLTGPECTVHHPINVVKDCVSRLTLEL